MPISNDKARKSPVASDLTELRTQCGSGACHHIRMSHEALSRRLAEHLGLVYAGNDTGNFGAGCYLVPRETLTGSSARPLSNRHFLGGWTATALLASKAIMHPALAAPRHLPDGWPGQFGSAAREWALSGITAFDLADARVAALELLKSGPVRLKKATGEGGQGQFVVRTEAELPEALDNIAPEDFRDGLVIEEDLAQLITLSIGQVEVPGSVISYVGRQELTDDNLGRKAYGGSRLLVIRGGFAKLLQQSLPEDVRSAISKAAAFDQLASQKLSGLLATRRNYDVAVGTTHKGIPRIGVLEQSWRIGGASGAEILALELLAERPEIRAVRVSTRERYGTSLMSIRPKDFIIFSGEDPEVGAINKTASVEAVIAA